MKLFTFSQKAAKKAARSLEKALTAMGVDLPHGKAIDVVAALQGYANGDALLQALSPETLDASLSPEERKHLQESSEDQYPAEAEVLTHTGFALRYPDSSEVCDYLRVVDPLGRETAYWACDEWAEDPQGVIGAVLGALTRGGALPAQKSGVKHPTPVRLKDSRLAYAPCEWTEDLSEQPGWIKFEVTEGFVNHLLTLRKLLGAAGMGSELTEAFEPVQWADDSVSLESTRVTVGQASFYFRAFATEDDVEVRTRDISFEALLSGIRLTRGQQKVEVQRVGDALIFEELSHRTSFLKQLEEDRELMWHQ